VLSAPERKQRDNGSIENGYLVGIVM